MKHTPSLDSTCVGCVLDAKYGPMQTPEILVWAVETGTELDVREIVGRD